MAVSAVQGYGFIGESRGYVYDSTLMAWIAATPGTAGGGSTQISIKEILTSSGASVMDSTANAINVNVVAGSAASDTTATVTPAAGSTWRSQPGSTAWASSAGFHFEASSGALQVTPGSSLWQVQPGSTNWPKAAGLSVDSSNAQNVKLDGSTALTIGSIAAGAGRLNIGSTATDNVVNVSSVAGIVSNLVADVVSSGTITSSGSFTVALNGHHGVGFTIENGTLECAYTCEISGDGSSWISAFYINSGVQKIGNSTISNPNAAITGDVILGEGQSHARFRVVSFVGGSARIHMRATMITSPLAFDGLTMGLVGSPVPLLAKMAGGSDGVNARMHQLRTTAPNATDYGLLVRNFQYDSTGLSIESSTNAAGANNSTRRGLSVRQTLPDSTHISGVVGTSGNVTLISSVAAQSIYVYAVHLMWPLGSSAAAGAAPPTTCVIQSGAGGGELFRATFTPPSTNSMAPAVDQAVTPPGYLFRTGAAALLNLNASAVNVVYSVSGWRE